MGRRALRKLPAHYDPARHLLRLESLAPPFREAEWFPVACPIADDLSADPEGAAGPSNPAEAPAGATDGATVAASTRGTQPPPLEIEVGSGKGLFLARAASELPHHNFLGIEIAAKYAELIAAKLAKLNLPNARVISGDAERFFAEHLADGQVHAVHIYFPDPWWKKRHHKRRIMNERFLNQVVRVLAADGRLHFWTDVEEYFRLSLELIRERIGLTGPLEVTETPAAHHLDYRTHFERRTRLGGLPVYRAEFVKRPTGADGRQ